MNDEGRSEVKRQEEEKKNPDEKGEIFVYVINMRRRKHRPLCIYTGMVTLNSELNKASSFAVRVDGVAGKEDRVLTLRWL